MRCQRCGHQVQEGNFCPVCGAPLREAPFGPGGSFYQHVQRRIWEADFLRRRLRRQTAGGGETTRKRDCRLPAVILAAAAIILMVLVGWAVSFRTAWEAFEYEMGGGYSDEYDGDLFRYYYDYGYGFDDGDDYGYGFNYGYGFDDGDDYRYEDDDGYGWGEDSHQMCSFRGNSGVIYNIALDFEDAF